MIKESIFVTIEIAQALRKLGFDEPCFAIHSNGELKLVIPTEETINSLFGEPVVCVPLYQQVFDWFREKYEIIAIVEYVYGATGKVPMFDGCIYSDYKENCDTQDENEFYRACELTVLETIKLINEVAEGKING